MSDVRAAEPHITLDPPYRLGRGDEAYKFIGWAEIVEPGAPFRLWINGLEVKIITPARPDVEAVFPGLQVRGLYAEVDFAKLFRNAPPPKEPFLLEVRFDAGGRERVFEYDVSDEWLEEVFGRPVERRPTPPDHLQVRVTGAAAGGFHRTGRDVAERIAEILDEAGHPIAARRRILDFGCGPGRVIGWVRDLSPGAKLFGSDIDEEAIAWAAANLGHWADFRSNGFEPPLPFADESFDLIYSISIFTHLPEEMQWAWLSELRRVLRPGGLLLTTKLNPEPYDLPDKVKAEGRDRGFVYWGEADATEGLPGFYRLAYHTDAYVRREWGRYFEVIHIGSHDLNWTQDAVLLRRPRHGLSWLPSPVRKALFRLLAPLAARMARR